MRRYIDLIRRIALEGADGATFAMHVIWMKEAGLISASVQEYLSGEPPKVGVHRLTWAGCEFVDAIRDDTLWQKAKVNVLKPGMSFTFDVLKDWLKTEITQGLPTIRAMRQQLAQIHRSGQKTSLCGTRLTSDM